jgi:hypothetical protein
MSTPLTDTDPTAPGHFELTETHHNQDESLSGGGSPLTPTQPSHAGVLSHLQRSGASGKRLDYKYLATERAHQGKSDTLHVLGAQQSRLVPVSPSKLTALLESLDPRQVISYATGAAGRAVAANPKAVDGTLGDVQKSVMKAICGLSGQFLATPTHMLTHLTDAAPNSISRFWADPSLPHGVARPSAALLGRIDELHGGEHKAPALALSFAFQGASGHGESAGTDVAALDLLRGDNLVESMAQAVRRPPLQQQDLAARLALATLSRAACGNQFPEVLALLGHTNLDKKQVGILQTMLHAHEASQQIAANPEAIEEGSATTELARSVALASAQRLEAREPLTVGQKTDIFVWRNKLGDHREEVKDNLKSLAEFYGYEDDEVRSPLRAAYLGLGGADYRTLKEEGAAVLATVDNPCVVALVNTLRDETSTRLAAATTTEEKAGLIAQLVALDNWTPARRADNEFGLHDVTNGRAYDMSLPDTVERASVESYCRYALAGQKVPIDGNLAATPPVADEAALEALKTSAHLHLSGIGMNMAALNVLADHYEVNDQMLQRQDPDATTDDLKKVLGKAGRAIYGETAKPASGRPDDAIALVSDFFSDAQFGNNVRYVMGHTSGVSSRGFAYNFAPLIYADPKEATRHPVLGRVNVGDEYSVSNVLRFGVATHGAEWSFGKETRNVANGGVGAQYGRTWGPEKHPSEFRVAGGLDVGLLTNEHTVFKGLVVRSMRLVDEDSVALDATPPTFAHRDKQVRDEMAALQPKIRARAKDLIDERNAAEAEGVPYNVDIGEEMLRCFAEDGMESGLSMGLFSQETNVYRMDASVMAGLSVISPGNVGVRSGIGGNVAVDWAVKQTFEQTDTSGLVQVINHREGSSKRLRTGASETENLFAGSGGVPSTDLAGATTLHGEAGAQAKVRFVLHEDKLVPRFCFSDAEFPDVEGYKRYLKEHEDAYAEMFSYRHDKDVDAGRKDLAEHVQLVEAVRKQNHVNYARARLMENYAKRIDELRGIKAMLPPEMEGFKAELDATQLAMMEELDAFQKVSGITYAVQTLQDGKGQTVFGIRGKASTDMTAEREIIFDTTGWGWLARRELDTNANVDLGGHPIRG